MKYFKGEIEGKKLNNFNKIDYSVEKLVDRNKFIDDLLGNAEFFTTYFGEYYDVSPSQSGYLAEETAVCRSLEIMGTYIIGAKDVPSERKVEYRFWRDEKDFKKSKESENVNASTSNGNGDVEIIDMFNDRKNDKNQKIVKPISVTKKDVKEIKEINELEKAIDYLKSESGINDIKREVTRLLEIVESEEDLVRLQYILKNAKQYVGRYVGDLKESQLLIKKAITKPVEFKNTLKDEGAPDKLEGFDFMEKNHVEALLPSIGSSDLMTDMGILAHDLNELLDRTKLSPKEMEIINVFREGFTRNDAQDELDIRKQNMTTYLKRIAEKVVKTYEIQVSDYRDKQRLKKVK